MSKSQETYSKKEKEKKRLKKRKEKQEKRTKSSNLCINHRFNLS